MFPGCATTKGLHYLAQAGCQSVYGAQPLVSRDEWAVPSNAQISKLTLKGYAESGQQLPFWCWPTWVHALGGVIQVDMAAIDRVPASAAVHARPSAKTYGVRVNSAGRPIHDDGKFMSYAEARSRGWGGAAAQNPWNRHQQSVASQGLSQREVSDRYRDSTSTSQKGSSSARRSNAWNEHQHAMGGQGHSRNEIRAAYRDGSTAAGSTATRRGSTQAGRNSWNDHQRAMGGQGYSRSQIQSSYTPTARVPQVSRLATASNSWNSHQRSMGGQGFTQAQIREAYWPSVSGAPSSSSSLAQPRAPNAWNDFQRAMGGQGLSRAEMRAAYHSSPSLAGLGGGAGSSHCLGGGGGLGWNAFRSSVAGQGMSRAEMSAAYHAQK